MFFELLSGFFANLAAVTAGLEPWQQGFFLVLIGAIPFVESYGGAFIGTLAGVHPVLAVAAPVIGNAICTFVVILLAARTRDAIRRRRDTAEAPRELSKRQQKVQRALDRYGVPGVCILGPLVVASQITAPTLIALGADVRKVIVFQGISIVLWGVAFMTLGTLLLRGLAAA